MVVAKVADAVRRARMAAVLPTLQHAPSPSSSRNSRSSHHSSVSTWSGIIATQHNTKHDKHAIRNGGSRVDDEGREALAPRTEVGLPGRLGGVLGELEQDEQGKSEDGAAHLIEQIHQGRVARVNRYRLRFE